MACLGVLGSLLLIVHADEARAFGPRDYAGPEAVAASAAQPDPAAEAEDPPVLPSSSPPAAPQADSGAAAPSKPGARPRRSLRLPSLGPVQPWVRVTSFAEYFRDNYDTLDFNDRFVAWVNRVNVGSDSPVGAGRLRAQIRVDTQNLWFPQGRACDPASSTPCALLGDDARLERKTLQYQSRAVDVTAGDFNVNVARGLALSIRKIDEIGVDATVQGGRVDVRAGPVELLALAGVANSQNSDFATRQRVPDPGFPGDCDLDGPRDRAIGSRWVSTCTDFVTAGRAQVTLPQDVRVGSHYAHLRFGEEVTFGTDERLHLVGGDVAKSGMFGLWDLYAGATARVHRVHAEATGDPIEALGGDGYAVYVSNSFVTSTGTSVLVEGKHYVDYLVGVQSTRLQYAEAPTLEREDQSVPGSFNATGGRVRVDHTLRDLGLTVFGNGLAYAFAENVGERAFEREDDQGRLATHGYGGVIWRRESGFSATLSGGYRHELHLEDERVRRRFPHGELYVTVPVGKTGGLRHGLNFRVEGRWEERQITGFDNERFVRGLTVLGYSMAPWLTLSFVGGVSTEFPAPDGAIALTDERCGDGANCKPHLWPGAEAKVAFPGGSFLRVFAGRQVGGRICVSGACRVVPDFEGVRSELVLSF